MRRSNGREMTRGKGRRGVPAPYALPAAFAALFAVGTVAAALNGRLPATGVLIAAAIVVGITALIAEPLASVPLGAIGWLTVAGFSRPPYADLRPTGAAAADAALVIGVTALGSGALGVLFRWLAARATLGYVSAGVNEDRQGAALTSVSRPLRTAPGRGVTGWPGRARSARGAGCPAWPWRWPASRC